METSELNIILFKLEEYEIFGSASADTLIASPGVAGTAYVSAINLLTQDSEFAADTTKDLADQTGTRDPSKVPTAISRYTINDTTDNLLSVNFITNSEGYARLDLSRMLTNTTFVKFYQKYRGEITLNITIEIPKTATYNVFVDNIKITPKWTVTDRRIDFESYNYYENDDSIILSSIADTVTDLATLRRTYKTVEENYLLVKKQFESQVSGNVDLEIDTVETYEPTTFKTVITRLLEFQIGTLQPAIAYTKTAKLTLENDRLTLINNLVNLLAKQYPDITIEDGEGIPYDTDTKLIAEA